MVAARFLSASALISLAFAAAQNNGGGSSSADGLSLLSSNVQKGSEVDGSDSIGAESGEALSQTSNDNFINFCSGKTLTNGLQILTGSCNGIPMGDIPAKTKMLSTVFLNPKNGQTIESGQTFNITLQVNNLQAGAFTNADATYYTAPQALNAQGDIIGHVHVTVQDVGNTLNPTQPPDPTQFAFFKGINDAGNGAGQLAATVTGGLPPGNYRVCTLTSAANHQPVIMPVAQRGSQDDCRYFTVNGNNNTENSAASDGSKGAAAAAAAASAVAAGPGAVTGGGGGSGAAAATSAAAAAATSAGSSGNNKGGNKNGNGGGAKAVGAGSGGKGSGSAAAATTAADKGGSGGAKAAATASGKGTAASAAAGGKGSGKGEKRDCATERRRRRYVS